LVEQDENGEPASASELLEQISKQGGRGSCRADVRTNDGSAGASPSRHHGVPAEDQPYLLPRSWAWSPLGAIADILMGNRPPGSSYNDSGEGEPLINGPVEFSPGPFGKTIKSKFTTEPTKMCKTNPNDFGRKEHQ
jgi:type I restriction enzyme S subunit